MKSITVMGLDSDPTNLGCAALAYSFYYLLDEVTDEKLEIKVVLPSAGDERLPTIEFKNIQFKFVRQHLSEFSSIRELAAQMKKSDFVFDFTFGDSFSDIYGFKRYLSYCVPKLLAVYNGNSLILGNQTYGPFKSLPVKLLTGHVLKKSFRVFSRDQLSSNCVYELSKRKAEQFVDIAFSLPTQKKVEIDHSKINIGLNVSGLLWNGGYNGGNQFNLSVNYKNYICRVIDKLLENDCYTIHIIPHVIVKNYCTLDNDLVACDELEDMYGSNVVIHRNFETPMEAKGIIAQMDVFTGARMHATIAGVSSGIATIPFSYSRKFEGLYNSIEYPYAISGLHISTEQAISDTLAYIKDYRTLTESARKSQHMAKNSIGEYKTTLSEILKG